MTENKVVIYQEPIGGHILSLLTFGLVAGSRVNPVKFTEFLNLQAEDGWRVVTMDRESRRSFIIFRREAFIIILER